MVPLRRLPEFTGQARDAPREFVVTVLKSVFRMSEDEANKVMVTAHTRGARVVAIYTREVAAFHPATSRSPDGTVLSLPRAGHALSV